MTKQRKCAPNEAESRVKIKKIWGGGRGGAQSKNMTKQLFRPKRSKKYGRNKAARRKKAEGKERMKQEVRTASS